MRFNSRRIIFVVALVAVFFIGSWGVVYASAERMLELFPAPGTIVANEQPTISANWLNVPGVHIQSVEVSIDGRIQEVDTPQNGTGVQISPDAPLSQGKHTVKARLTYGLGISRQVEAEWSFTVDTEPPPLSLADGAAFYVSPNATAEVPVKTEADAQVEVVLNDKPVRTMTADRNGSLKVDLAGLDDRNKLTLMAADSVGNMRSMVLPVIKDEVDPVIRLMKPEDGEVVRAAAPMVEVDFTEEDSGLTSIKLMIDDQEAVVKADDGSKKIAYLGDLLVDGSHKAKVEAVDYAGRSLTKEWSFAIDSRRIVVNRGERKLYYYRNGRVERVYGVAVGQPAWPTPSGHFRVVNKQAAPTWINPGSSWAKDMPKRIPPGPGNPLGVRALALSAQAILIHGTSNYGSIGSAASHGCIRMRNSDIVGFFSLVDVDVPVDIIN